MTAALKRLKQDCNERSISLSSKLRLMCSLITSIFLYACESWTLTAELQRKIQAVEMRCYCKILSISYKDHVTNEEVCVKIQQAIRPLKDLLFPVHHNHHHHHQFFNCEGHGAHVHQVWPKPPCRAQ